MRGAARDIPALIEDVEWMVESGEHMNRAARRLSISPVTLQRILTNAGRHDLAARLSGTWELQCNRKAVA